MTDVSQVLIMDEEPIREEIAAYLEDAGFAVIQARDGQEGITLFRSKRPDLVLVDIQVPKVEGLDILETLTKESPDTPVLMMSSLGKIDDAVESLRLGAWDYILKPIKEMAMVEHSLCKALERSRLVRENEAYRIKLEKTNTQLLASLRELEEDQKAGRHVQLQILPSENFKLKPYTFAHKIFPSLYLSGDFVDYFQITETKLGFYIADVSGHGASSAFVTVLLKSLISQCLSQTKSGEQDTILYPNQLLKKISDELLKIKLGKYLTMIYGVLDIQNNTLIYAIGGHYPSPILTDGKMARFLEGSGYAVGIYEKAEYHNYEIQLPEKFSLVMFSDGILETIKKTSLEEQESLLMKEVNAAYADPEKMTKAFKLELGKSLPDDVTMFMVNRG